MNALLVTMLWFAMVGTSEETTTVMPAECQPVTPGKTVPPKTPPTTSELYDDLKKTTDRFEEQTRTTQSDFALLVRYPIQLKRTFHQLRQTHALAQDLKSEKAGTSVSPKKINGVPSVVVPPKTDEKASPPSHPAPDPAELKRRAEMALQGVPTSWVDKQLAKADKLFDQLEARLTEKKADRAAIGRLVAELRTVVEGLPHYSADTPAIPKSK